MRMITSSGTSSPFSMKALASRPDRAAGLDRRSQHVARGDVNVVGRGLDALRKVPLPAPGAPSRIIAFMVPILRRDGSLPFFRNPS